MADTETKYTLRPLTMNYLSIALLLFTSHGSIKSVGAGDPNYPELGDNPRLENKVPWPNMGPNYQKPPSKDVDPWFLVMQSESKMKCPLVSGQKYTCQTVPTSTYSKSTADATECQAWCEDGSTTDTSVEWQNGAYCMYDGG